MIFNNFRTDTDEMFALSGIREDRRLSHYPFLAITEKEGDPITVDIVNNAIKLLEYPDDTQVIKQWGGEWRSDWFQFTVGDLRKYIEKNPKTKDEDYYIV